MDRQSVDSSNIAAIGFDEETQTLEIEFLNGRIYQYFDVPKNTFDELMSAPSKGKYFIEIIKGTFRFVKI